MAAVPVGHPSRAELRDRAIEAWLPLAAHLAGRYRGRGEPVEDLVQTANVGLIKAVDRFDPDRGYDFLGYAVPTIVGEIKRHFRDRAWWVRVPRRLQELRMRITEANSILPNALGRPPRPADIAAYLGVTEEDVLDGLEGCRAYNAISLSTPVGADGRAELGDILGADDHGYELTEARLALGTALASLDERERRIVILRFYGNLAQSEIGNEVGLSQMHVSRLLRAALAKLHDRMTDPPATRAN
jgi:RNA polymerase sigma-B factor